MTQLPTKKKKLKFDFHRFPYQNKQFARTAGRAPTERLGTIRTNLNVKLKISWTSTVDWHDTAVDKQLFMIAFGNDVDDGGGEKIKKRSVPSGVCTSIVGCMAAAAALDNYTHHLLSIIASHETSHGTVIITVSRPLPWLAATGMHFLKSRPTSNNVENP